MVWSTEMKKFGFVSTTHNLHYLYIDFKTVGAITLFFSLSCSLMYVHSCCVTFIFSCCITCLLTQMCSKVTLYWSLSPPTSISLSLSLLMRAMSVIDSHVNEKAWAWDDALMLVIHSHKEMSSRQTTCHACIFSHAENLSMRTQMCTDMLHISPAFSLIMHVYEVN